MRLLYLHRQPWCKVAWISVPAANAALNNLLAAGIVSLVNERQWGRLFQATEVLHRLNEQPAPRQR
jgi:hypothetical protein